MTKFSLLTIAAPYARLEAEEGSLFEPFAVTEEGVLFSLLDGRVVDGGLPELPCLGLVAREEAHLDLLEALQDKFRAARMPFIPDIVLVEQALSYEALMLGAAFGMEAYLGQQAQLVSQLSRDLYEMRRQHDTLQDTLSRLEDYFYARRVSLVEEFFVTEPKALVDVSAKSLKSKSAVQQVLPATSKTLSAFSLHIGREDRKAKGVLHVAIHVPETRKNLWTWRLNIKDLAAGWLQFGLPETLGGIAKSAVLHLRIEGEAGQFRLSVGGVNPLPLYHLGSTRGDSIVDRALALRLFISPPGIAVRHDGATCLPVEKNGTLPAVVSGADDIRIKISRDWLSRVRRLADDGWAEPGFESVGADCAAGTVMVHPVWEAPTIAFLPECVPAGATRVEADVLVDNMQAGVVAFRFGLVLGPAFGGQLDTLLRTDTVPEGVVLSEWVLLGPGRRQTLSIPIDGRGGEANASLVMITRMPDGVSPDFAWAKFADLRFVLP
ncbi:MAG: hypothetical protein LCH39_04450 [Proteobacteria bacterium]|nr:hypothetical protein [Pseudomonadota bacterium]